MATIAVKDAATNTQNVELPLPPGRAAASASKPVVLSTEDLAALAPVLAAGTDRSGTITTGGTAQQLAASNSSRKSLTGQNISSGDLWINQIGGTAAPDTAGSYKIPTGATFSVSTNRAISVYGLTTGQAWTAEEF